MDDNVVVGEIFLYRFVIHIINGAAARIEGLYSALQLLREREVLFDVEHLQVLRAALCEGRRHRARRAARAENEELMLGDIHAAARLKSLDAAGAVRVVPDEPSLPVDDDSVDDLRTARRFVKAVQVLVDDSFEGHRHGGAAEMEPLEIPHDMLEVLHFNFVRRVKTVHAQRLIDAVVQICRRALPQRIAEKPDKFCVDCRIEHF